MIEGTYAGLRVLVLGQAIAGLCAMGLAMCGAEVVKLEAPGGD